MTDPKDIQLFCSDIDGTLLNVERWLSPETIAAFSETGLPIILASSRPPNAMRYIQDGLGHSGAPLIAYNGGLIIGKKDLIIESNTFDLRVLEALLPHYSAHDYNLSIYSHDYWFTEKEDSWSLREINNTRITPIYQTPAKSLAFMKDNHLGIHKLMCMGNPDTIDSIVKTVLPVVGTDVHLYRSKDTYLEITPKFIDKAKALQTLLKEYYNVGLEGVMSFGDNHNDDELIRQSGIGVAVGNATNTLKSIADYVSPYTNKEHAVAHTIRHFMGRVRV